MKHILFLVYSVLTFHLSFGQTQNRNWNKGDLTWKDFLGVPIEQSNLHSQLNYELFYKTYKVKFKDTTAITFKTESSINPNTSWIKTDYKNFQFLKYNQVIFNLVESQRRQLQKQLFQISNLQLADELLRNHFRQCQNRIRSFELETNFGMNKKVVEKWENIVRQELKSFPTSTLPHYKTRKFGYGLNIAFGFGLLTGSLGNHFSSSINFGYGFDVAFKNYILFLNGIFIGPKVKKDFTENDRIWKKNLKTRGMIADASIGYAVKNGSKHKLTPFIGYSVIEISTISKDKETNNWVMVSSNPIGGIVYDFKFHKRLRFTPAPGIIDYKEKVEHKIRTRLYITTGKFENFKGASINLSIGYSIFGNFIRITN